MCFLFLLLFSLFFSSFLYILPFSFFFFSFTKQDPRSPCVLSHGDLHPGSVMANGSKVKVIDPEFTVYGPCGLDVGSLLSGFLLAALHHAHRPASAGDAAEHARARRGAVASLRASAAAVWDAYVAALLAGGVSEAHVARAGAEAVGFAAAEACRTALGFAGGRKWLQFDGQPAAQAAAQAATLALVQRCMVARHAGGMALFLRELDALVTVGSA
jgi:5-methylthioribose kinase